VFIGWDQISAQISAEATVVSQVRLPVISQVLAQLHLHEEMFSRTRAYREVPRQRSIIDPVQTFSPHKNAHAGSARNGRRTRTQHSYLEKRQCTDASYSGIGSASASSPGEEFVKRSDLEEMLAELQKSNSAVLATSVASVAETANGNLLANLGPLLPKMEAKNSASFEILENEISAVSNRQNKFAASLEATRAQLASLTQHLAVAEATVGAVDGAKTMAFDRPLDSALVRFNTTGMVSKIAVISEVIQPLLAKAGIEMDQTLVTADAIDRNFTLTFKGERSLAARRATKVLDSMRTENGSWVQLQVEARTRV
jgi:hypothetical protein